MNLLNSGFESVIMITAFHICKAFIVSTHGGYKRGSKYGNGKPPDPKKGRRKNE
jgi:hypothetical protein